MAVFYTVFCVKYLLKLVATAEKYLSDYFSVGSFCDWYANWYTVLFYIAFSINKIKVFAPSRKILITRESDVID